MLDLYPVVHQRVGDEVIPVAVFIVLFAAHNGQAAIFGCEFQSLYALSVERCLRQPSVIDGPLGQIIMGISWSATELLTQMEIVNPSARYRGLQGFAVELRRVSAVGLTAGIDQQSYGI